MLRFSNGLIPAVVVDDRDGTVLSLYYMDREALRRTRRTRYLWRYSRTLCRTVKKGATSGNTMRVASVCPDCEGKSLLIRVVPGGPACHTGRKACYSCPAEGRKAGKASPDDRPSAFLEELFAIIEDRKRRPKKGSVVSALVRKPQKAAGKLVEECLELCLARSKTDVGWEAADVLLFALVLAASKGATLGGIVGELRRRNAR